MHPRTLAEQQPAVITIRADLVAQFGLRHEARVGVHARREQCVAARELVVMLGLRRELQLAGAGEVQSIDSSLTSRSTVSTRPRRTRDKGGSPVPCRDVATATHNPARSRCCTCRRCVPTPPARRCPPRRRPRARPSGQRQRGRTGDPAAHHHDVATAVGQLRRRLTNGSDVSSQYELKRIRHSQAVASHCRAGERSRTDPAARGWRGAMRVGYGRTLIHVTALHQKSATLPHADSLNRPGRRQVPNGCAPDARSAIRCPAPGPMPKPCPETPPRGSAPARRHFADARHAVRRAVDEPGPRVRDLRVAQFGQQVGRAAYVSVTVGMSGFGSRMRTASIGVGASRRQCFSVSWPPRTFEPPASCASASRTSARTAARSAGTAASGPRARAPLIASA